jgi:streptogramin lyase
LYGLYAIYGMSGEGIFEVEKNGSNLQAFPFYTTEGGAGFPMGLLLASDGNFWMANLNGTTAYGNIVELSPATASILQTFNVFAVNAAVGAFPSAIIEAKDGTLWGLTSEYGKALSGDFSDGTVFRFNVGLPPQ